MDEKRNSKESNSPDTAEDYQNQSILGISPHDLINFSDSETAQVILKNISKQPIVFKIKTTVPYDYSVRPSVGMLEPRASVIVNIELLKGFDPTKRHRFLIQATPFLDSPPPGVDHETYFKSSPVFSNPAQANKLDVKLPEAVDAVEIEKVAPALSIGLANRLTMLEREARSAEELHNLAFDELRKEWDPALNIQQRSSNGLSMNYSWIGAVILILLFFYLGTMISRWELSASPGLAEQQ